MQIPVGLIGRIIILRESQYVKELLVTMVNGQWLMVNSTETIKTKTKVYDTIR